MSTQAGEPMADGAQEYSYPLLNPQTVPDYIRSKPHLREIVDPSNGLHVKEVGDGNLNLVFVVKDGTDKGLVLKQALPYVRMVGPQWPFTPNRATAEARAYESHSALAPEYVPAYYGFDAERFTLAMEDLSDHRVWRRALIDQHRHPGAAADMGRYVARVAFGTSLFGVEAKQLKRRVAAAVNPELCEITENLVFTEPYIEHERNSFQPAIRPMVESLRADAQMVAGMGELKYLFMTSAEALIHGDLHTGSVMVRPANGTRPRSTRAFDLEFAYYGPIGFDVGALWGNYFLALARARVLRLDDFASWLLELPEETWLAFEQEFRSLWPNRIDPRVYNDEFLERWLDNVRREAMGFAGAEAARRIVGLAHVADIETLPEEPRSRACRGVLEAARYLVTQRERVADVGQMTRSVDEIIKRVVVAG